ncbi:MAG: hypothetical protein IPO16_14850 [Saprospiraceae bacterium]|nr:hypothetical protein [Saprospiraceae bacterium]
MACSNCTNGCTRCDPRNVGSNSLLKNFKLTNPIPEEITDGKYLRNFFGKNLYVPYAGFSHDSQHSVLGFLDNLVTMSPTLGGVINSIRHSCFGGKTNIKKIVDFDFDLTDENDVLTQGQDISIEEKKKFLAWIKEFDLGALDISSLKNSLFNSYKANGNTFIIVEIFQSLGSYKIKITPLQTKNCLYLNPNLFEDKNIAVSRSWDQKYLKENPPKIYPAYPFFSKDKDGTVKTIFHLKNGDNEFYGRPDWMSCIYDSFLEVKNKEYLLSAAHNMFTGKLIIEVEGDPVNGSVIDDEEAKKEGFRDSSHRFDYNFTNQGDNPMSVFMMNRPVGATPMTTHEIALNMNEKYYSEVDRMSTDKIILVNGWSRKLLGIQESSGMDGNSFLDTMKIKLPLIEYYQDLIDNQVLNKIFRFIAEQTNRLEFLEIGVESKNPFDHLIKAMDTGKQDPIKSINDALNNNK